MTAPDRARPGCFVTFDLWRVPTRRVPRAVARMALDRAPLRRVPGLRFSRLLGVGAGRTFTIRDADPHRWALLAVWSSPRYARAFEPTRVGRGWSRLADEHWRLDLHPVRARGRWAGRTPFGRPGPDAPPDAPGDPGPVVALTRARLAPRRAARFWRAVPPVAAELAGSDGLRFAIGFGEAPLGFQGTLSVWDSVAALRRFAYHRPAHVAALRRTDELGWYAEELFARFTVVGSHGTADGRDPVAPRLQASSVDHLVSPPGAKRPAADKRLQP
jgi:hypothetical protein